MASFTRLTGVAAPLPLDDVDTDKVIPAAFMKGLTRDGLGAHLFRELRYTPTGHERPDFVLNHSAFRDARILIAGRNFGCGSSREHAVWALADFGIRCVIAPSFGDIFASNCVKNGVLLIRLDTGICAQICDELARSQFAPVTVDLETQQITLPTGAMIAFEVDPTDRQTLIDGLDEIGRTLRYEADIARYETARSAA